MRRTSGGTIGLPSRSRTICSWAKTTATNGIGLSWAHAGFTEFSPDNIPRWLHYLSKDLYIGTMPGKQRAVSYAIDQLMQTPSDIKIPALIENEAPYAGLLVWSGNLHAFDDRVADGLSLTLGVVGPLSGAEQAQKWVHALRSLHMADSNSTTAAK